MGIWDMLTTPKDKKDKMRSKTDRAAAAAAAADRAADRAAAKGLFSNGNGVNGNGAANGSNGASNGNGDAAADASPSPSPTSNPKLERAFSPTPGASKRKNTDATDEASKRLRSGTVMQPPQKSELLDRAERAPSVASMAGMPRSPHRLSMSSMRSKRMVQQNTELDNDAIAQAQIARSNAEIAEMNARNQLNKANLALEDWLGKREEAEGNLANQDRVIADLLAQVEAARKVRDELCERLLHVNTHFEDASVKAEEWTEEVAATMHTAKQAQVNLLTLMRGTQST